MISILCMDKRIEYTVSSCISYRLPHHRRFNVIRYSAIKRSKVAEFIIRLGNWWPYSHHESHHSDPNRNNSLSRKWTILRQFLSFSRSSLCISKVRLVDFVVKLHLTASRSYWSHSRKNCSKNWAFPLHQMSVVLDPRRFQKFSETWLKPKTESLNAWLRKWMINFTLKQGKFFSSQKKVRFIFYFALINSLYFTPRASKRSPSGKKNAEKFFINLTWGGRLFFHFSVSWKCLYSARILIVLDLILDF